MAEFNINELYRRQFNFNALPYPEALPPVQQALRARKNPVAEAFEQIENNLDVPKAIRMPMRLRVPGQDWYDLPNEPIVSISGSKEVVVTTLNRGKKRGTVKEEVSLGDYKIAVRGIIYNSQQDTYPADDVRKLRNLLEYGGNLEVQGYLFDLFNIGLVVVEGDYAFPRDMSMSFRLATYEFNLLSDEDFERELLDPNNKNIQFR